MGERCQSYKSQGVEDPSKRLLLKGFLGATAITLTGFTLGNIFDIFSLKDKTLFPQMDPPIDPEVWEKILKISANDEVTTALIYSIWVSEGANYECNEGECISKKQAKGPFQFLDGTFRKHADANADIYDFEDSAKAAKRKVEAMGLLGYQADQQGFITRFTKSQNGESCWNNNQQQAQNVYQRWQQINTAPRSEKATKIYTGKWGGNENRWQNCNPETFSSNGKNLCSPYCATHIDWYKEQPQAVVIESSESCTADR
ncbi:hypothetical protein A2Z22_00510 [Candidatus Woesebacteria bacterium RBG_16_34_12]|uniref:Transglycosylase SLT domain-containing protein n=1 Tax=Candidatus Woesebacteria bacterium RBG_16_34_12 TaxID=1802480 RepID=A0A1F7X924_9BACT|nr:MAG: hypothetical protein A2Z22_00510 [Candidatus Woesebacteria bacterium RBG_16_34_12]